jgi:hypothetical protein
VSVCGGATIVVVTGLIIIAKKMTETVARAVA